MGDAMNQSHITALLLISFGSLMHGAITGMSARDVLGGTLTGWMMLTLGYGVYRLWTTGKIW